MHSEIVQRLTFASVLIAGLHCQAVHAQSADLSITDFSLHQANFQNDVSEKQKAAILDAYRQAAEDMATKRVARGKEWDPNQKFEVVRVHTFVLPTGISAQIILRSYELDRNSYLFISTDNPKNYLRMSQKDLESYGGKTTNFPPGKIIVSLLQGTADKKPKMVLERVRVYDKPTIELFHITNPENLDELRQPPPEIDELRKMSLHQSSLCGDDNRISSCDKRVGRLAPANGSAFLIQDDVALSAGHFWEGAMEEIHFEIPDSKPDGTPNLADLDHQYEIEVETMESRYDLSSGYGADWAVFRVKPNLRTGFLPGEAQGSVFKLSQKKRPSAVRVTGFGEDRTPSGTTGGLNSQNRTLQTENGSGAAHAAFITIIPDGKSSYFEYKVDIENGNSGSPVYVEGAEEAVVAIQTYGGCPTGKNKGTALSNTDLKAAIQNFVLILSNVYVD